MIEDLTKIGLFPFNMLMELLVAVICGGLIGLRHGGADRFAGLTENTLICMGCVLFANVGELLGINSAGDSSVEVWRISANVTIAVSVIALGMILQGRDGPSGNAIAVTIWVTAAIGLIIGFGQWLLGLLVTGLTLLVLTLLRSLEKTLSGPVRPFLLRITVRQDSEELRGKVKIHLEKSGIEVTGFRSERVPGGVKMIIHGTNEPADIRPLIAALWGVRDIVEIEH